LAFAWHKVAPWPSVYASHTKIRIGSYRRSAEKAGDSDVDESRKPDHQDRPVHYPLKSVFDGTGLL
ncbi:hypothetical protein, partial [Burkholderia multivorans]|uniref:hypothetical protein n=1 Tax=Burkholderia multivorans TaxID=87883 RepID=UPI0011B23D3E